MNNLQVLKIADTVKCQYSAKVVGVAEDTVEIELEDHYNGEMVAQVVTDSHSKSIDNTPIVML